MLLHDFILRITATKSHSFGPSLPSTQNTHREEQKKIALEFRDEEKNPT